MWKVDRDSVTWASAIFSNHLPHFTSSSQGRTQRNPLLQDRTTCLFSGTSPFTHTSFLQPGAHLCPCCIGQRQQCHYLQTGCCHCCTVGNSLEGHRCCAWKNNGNSKCVWVGVCCALEHIKHALLPGKGELRFQIRLRLSVHYSEQRLCQVILTMFHFWKCHFQSNTLCEKADRLLLALNMKKVWSQVRQAVSRNCKR